MSESISIEELERKLRVEYHKIKETEWNELFWALIQFLKDISRKSWMRRLNQETLCACLACHRLNIPIGTPPVSILTRKGETNMASNLKTLASYRILIPIEPRRSVRSGLPFARCFRFNPDFLKLLGES